MVTWISGVTTAPPLVNTTGGNSNSALNSGEAASDAWYTRTLFIVLILLVLGLLVLPWVVYKYVYIGGKKRRAAEEAAKWRLDR